MKDLLKSRAFQTSTIPALIPRNHRKIVYLEHFEKERGSHGGEVFGGEIGPVSGDEVGAVIAQNGSVDLLGHLVKPDAVENRDRRHQRFLATIT